MTPNPEGMVVTASYASIRTLLAGMAMQGDMADGGFTSARDWSVQDWSDRATVWVRAADALIAELTKDGGLL
jgi:hypothetical protein